MSGDPSNAVVHLTMRKGEHELAVGSGVLYRRNNRVYIVTAWHNVSGRHVETLRPLSSTAAVPDNVVATVACNTFANGQYFGHGRRPFTIPLEETGAARYFIHKQGWPRVDVAAIPIDPEYQYASVGTLGSGVKVSIPLPMRWGNRADSSSSDIDCIQDFESAAGPMTNDFLSSLDLSDDLFIPGYPKGLTDLWGQPLWKRATVASSPQAARGRTNCFLIDCASRQGMSGAPTIFFNRKGLFNHGSPQWTTTGPVCVFHGVYTGRVGTTSEFEAQIGSVWMRDVVDEIIDDQIWAPRSEEICISEDEVAAAIEQSWPHDEPNYAEQLIGTGFYAEFFTKTVMEAVKGRANPADVRDQILRVARHKIAHIVPVK